MFQPALVWCFYVGDNCSFLDFLSTSSEFFGFNNHVKFCRRSREWSSTALKTNMASWKTYREWRFVFPIEKTYHEWRFVFPN